MIDGNRMEIRNKDVRALWWKKNWQNLVGNEAQRVRERGELSLTDISSPNYTDKVVSLTLKLESQKQTCYF